MERIFTLDNCTVLTVDQADTTYADGRVVVANGRIKQVGAAAEVPLAGERVDMDGALVMPGLVNTHTHSHSSIFRSLADDLELMDWLHTAIWPMEKSLSHPRMAAAAALSYLEYLRGGATTVADQIYYADTVAKAAQKSGIRCFLAASVFSGPGPAPDTGDTFADAKRFVEQWQGAENETRVYPCIGPHAPYSVEGELWQRVAAYAEKRGLLVHTHISETADENRQIQEKTGQSPTAWLESLGVFSVPTLAAHSIHLSEADIAIYAKHHVAASYNPVSNLKLVSGIMPYPALRQAGVTVAIGTDGAQSNNSMDLLRDLRTGTLLQKQFAGDATLLPAREAVRLATIEGARALRFDAEIGSLEAGKRADLIALDTKSERLVPLHRGLPENLYSLVCYTACGADVRDVMVEGEWVQKNYECKTLDAAEVYAAAQAASEHLVANR